MLHLFVDFGYMHIGNNDEQQNEYQRHQDKDNIIAVFFQEGHISRFGTNYNEAGLNAIFAPVKNLTIDVLPGNNGKVGWGKLGSSAALRIKIY